MVRFSFFLKKGFLALNVCIIFVHNSLFARLELFLAIWIWPLHAPPDFIQTHSLFCCKTLKLFFDFGTLSACDYARTCKFLNVVFKARLVVPIIHYVLHKHGGGI